MGNNHFNLQPKQAKNLETVEKYDIILFFHFQKIEICFTYADFSGT